MEPEHLCHITSCVGVSRNRFKRQTHNTRCHKGHHFSGAYVQVQQRAASGTRSPGNKSTAISDWAPEVGWESVDWNEAASGSTKTIVWTIPASRMKGKKIAKKAHRVPVSTALLKVFLENATVHRQSQRDPRYIFPSTVNHRAFV